MQVQINDINLNIEILGDKEPTIIWAHGLMGCIKGELENCAVPIKEMSQRAKVIMYDARGHGESDDDVTSANQTYEKLADDMLAIAEHFKLSSFYLGGTSKGAATAIWAATKTANKIDGLILNAVPDAWETKQLTTQQHQQVIDALKSMDLEVFCKQLKMAPLPESMIGLENKREIDLENVASHPTETIMAILKGAAQSDLPSPDKVNLIKCPTLILALRNMPGHSDETSNQLSQFLANSDLLIGNNQDHLRQFAPQILNFLK